MVARSGFIIQFSLEEISPQENKFFMNSEVTVAGLKK